MTTNAEPHKLLKWKLNFEPSRSEVLVFCCVLLSQTYKRPTSSYLTSINRSIFQNTTINSLTRAKIFQSVLELDKPKCKRYFPFYNEHQLFDFFSSSRIIAQKWKAGKLVNLLSFLLIASYQHNLFWQQWECQPYVFLIKERTFFRLYTSC